MIAEIMIATLLGILTGIFTGLIPGIHINLVSVLMLSFSAFLLSIASPLILAVYIIAMSITHSFLNVLPAVFLGAPESSDNILTVLPGHRMLLQGKAYEAILLTVIGSFLAIIIGIILTPLLLMFLPKMYNGLNNYIPYILLIVVFFLIFREKQKLVSLFIFLLAGVFGLIVLNLNIKNPLFPLLSSLFGVAGLLVSLKDNIKIPPQIIDKIHIPKLDALKAVSSASIVGTFVSILPGLGPAEAAIIGSQITKLTDKGFLILVGALDTLGMVVSFIAIVSIEKARNGSVITISKLMETISINDLYLFLLIAFLSGVVSIFLTMRLTKVFSKLISKVNYQKLSISIIILILTMTFFLSGFLGLFILIIGSFIGMLPPLFGIGRNHLMGCLLIPVILFFLL